MATKSSQAGAAPVSGVAASEERTYMDWGAIIAGAVLTTAVSFILLTFGTAIGLSMTSPFEGQSASPVAFAIATALWLLWVQVSSYMAGGYLTGRMRRRMRDATEHESDVRDGAHGLVVWALGVLISAAVAAMVLTGVVKGGAQVIGGAAQTAAQAAGGDSSGPTGYAVDSLFRGSRATGPEAQAPREEVTRILAGAAARGGLTPEDRAYIGQVVARQTGMSPQDAESRVNEVLAKARQAADKARKTGIVTAFLTAAAVLAGAAGAWWAAQTGGNHRDRGTDFSYLFRRRRVP